MLKPNHIREIITRANPYLKRDPDKLQVFLDEGRIACRGANSLSYEYAYTLNVIVQDYPHHADRIIIPLLAYLRAQQPELFENRDNSDQVIRFDAEFLNHKTLDLSIQVDLTERVLVKQTEGGLEASYPGEPEHPEYPTKDMVVDVYDRKQGNKHLGQFKMPAWNPYNYTELLK